MINDEKITQLRNFALFDKLNEQDLQVIAPLLDEAVLHPGHTFVKEGSLNTDIYFIVSGLVRIFHLHETGKEVTITTRLSGDIIGEMALINNQPRSANIETLEETHVFVAKRDDFMELIARFPELGLALSKIISDRLRESIQAQKTQSFEPLSERTYLLLRSLSGYFTNHVTLTHEQLSRLVNATQPRVTEALNHLQKSKRIRLSRKNIILS